MPFDPSSVLAFSSKAKEPLVASCVYMYICILWKHVNRERTSAPHMFQTSRKVLKVDERLHETRRL